ncbi:glycosyltransferase family 4 protein [Plebeiibacterium sediminum]|uniref:Glycosyltransferase family 4 protein n=1 Tax=Plebeiibacterium sediminum TaxID=2992112 RepID=A0AAE3M4Z8_9BACT|nr:glycosyltransferase family 1 protein [Plebeiobacterium sediminum]MCW3786760.1 glycosyltransferase family 4 protein [Plebeiobacterium sediminum]
MSRNCIYINARFLTQKVTGVQRFAIELSKHLKDSELIVKWVAPKNIVNKELAEFLDVELIGRNKGHLWEQIDLPKYLKDNGNPLLLNLCNTAPLLYKNSVSTIHDLAFLENPKWFSKKFYWYYRILIPRIAYIAKHIITVSEVSKEEICDRLHVKKEKVSVVYNAVSECFTNKKKEVLEIEDYILFVGSLDPRKNLYTLIEAMSYTSNDIKLKVVGCSGKNFSDFGQDIRHKQIDVLGYVSDEELLELYRKARAFVYPSLYEGFGIPPLEAQSMGVPVLVSNIPVFKEVFADSVKYCNPYSAIEMAESICNIFCMSKEELDDIINKGYSNVNRFSWTYSARILVNELLKIKNAS